MAVRRRHAAARSTPTGMRTALRLANRRVFQASEERVEYAGMGTTIVAALVTGRTLTFASIGDSRIYSCVDGAISRLTVDDRGWRRWPRSSPISIRRSSPIIRCVTSSRARWGRWRKPSSRSQSGRSPMAKRCSLQRRAARFRHRRGAAARDRDGAPALADGRAGARRRALAAGGRDNVTALLVRYDED